ncbi:hypothetical protein ABB37_00333 [Leptomonas pyrrhocoris]|uniref:FCP1 homology domain-containing protein n=1 Tax=Leptomonas pyrrhocoris TaxID=157538 RepID=A0A0N0E059_LEPPY|nr:hypothetical protein ABB37_00333 [Leptomonas pyrrhocoris]KPA86065.1 hypothetical protein ABB37_00333 [Leptomonas pyrrhocoris]|eukprot:XP_015664504.1 hypothetical protein ABB37_00333 [Leptomonas pyrrhocoris]
MNSQLSPASLDGGGANFMHRDRFEVNQYVRVQVSATRFAIGVVTSIDEDHDKATVETRNGYEVTLPISSLHRAFLVVLDLNGVLVARGRGSFILRPHVMDFLKFVFSNFVVAVWTSGLQRSSNPIIEHVFGSYRDLLLFTLFRDSCVSKATPENPYGTEKNLQTIFDRYPLSFHAVNTIIIDDSPDKCSHPDIALCPVPFKDPVAQSQDDGLLETMETLRQVLLLDSGAPLILAAEERLHRLAEQQQQQRHRDEDQSQQPQQEQSGTTPPSVTAPGASSSNSEPQHSPEYPGVPADMEEVELWRTRLCCENLMGTCARGETCPFSHDPDDSRPCSRKSNCRYHGSRWPKTSEEAEQEVARRQLREAKQRQRKVELEQRRHEQQQEKNSRRGQLRGPTDLLSQLQQSVASSSSSLPLQRQRGGGGGGRHRQERRHPRRNDRRDEDAWGGGEEEAHDNTIHEQQQQRWSTATAGRGSSPTQGSYNLNGPQERSDWKGSTSSPHPTVGDAFGEASYTHLNGNSGNNDNHLSSSYRRLMQHHNQNSLSHNASADLRHEAHPQSHEQQRHGQDSQVAESVSFFFQNATTTTIEPFSTRPIAPSPPSVQQPAMQPFPGPPASLFAAPSGQNQNFGTGGSYRGLPEPPQPQTIHISGSCGDSNAVVNQLQALMRKS